jgi:hypothetical protein
VTESIVFFDLLTQTLPGGQDSLGSFLVLPEIGLGYLFLERIKFFAALGGVKESSATRWRVASSRHTLFAVLRSRLLLISPWRRAATSIRTHSRESGNPAPQILGNTLPTQWIPAFAGMTGVWKHAPLTM